MSEPNWKHAGIVGVDAGLIWIGDPCYVVTPDCTEHPAQSWSEFCDQIPSGTVCKQFNFRAGHEGLGVCVSTYMGDGCYPVYVDRDIAGRIRAVMVRFDEPEEPTDDDDDYTDGDYD